MLPHHNRPNSPREEMIPWGTRKWRISGGGEGGPGALPGLCQLLASVMNSSGGFGVSQLSSGPGCSLVSKPTGVPCAPQTAANNKPVSPPPYQAEHS